MASTPSNADRPRSRGRLLDSSPVLSAAGEADLAEARALFEAATLRLSHLEAAGLGTLTDTIAEAVKTLAAQRAGQMIDEMPAPFVKRVEALADRVAQGVSAVTVRLNPDDFAAIKPHLSGSDLLNPDRWLLWLGVLFILLVYFFPKGIAGTAMARGARS